MNEIQLTKQLESGEWILNIFEAGTTYKIATHKEDKKVFFMLNKPYYLAMLLDKQNSKTSTMEHMMLYCTGREFLTESEFDEMKMLLITHMDTDLSQEKILYDIVSKENK